MTRLNLFDNRETRSPILPGSVKIDQIRMRLTKSESKLHLLMSHPDKNFNEPHIQEKSQTLKFMDQIVFTLRAINRRWGSSRPPPLHRVNAEHK